MKLTIVAATGGIGRHLVEQAVADGHDVTAVARRPRELPDGVRTVAVDLTRPDMPTLATAVRGADAVLSALGPRNPRADAGITSRGTRAIVEAMQAEHVRRIIIVSAAPVGPVPVRGRPTPPRHDPGDGFYRPRRPDDGCGPRLRGPRPCGAVASYTSFKPAEHLDAD
ncbi:NAD(P)-dependent oxidoreductase [Streptomyces sp. NPDC003015]